MSERQLARGWAHCTLGDLLVTIRGITYAKEQALAAPAPGYVPILRATNIDRKVQFEDFVFVPRELVSAEQFLRAGDIVIAASSGSKRIVGKAAQLSQDWEGSFGAFCMGIRPTHEIEPRYVGYFLQSDEYRHRISDLAAGSNINNLKREHIESFPFRLAPSPEQGRIAEKIEELLSDLDASVAALERARANLRRYRAAVLKAAVEGKLTAEWRKANPPKEPADKLLERILAERRKKWEEAQLSKYAAQGKQPPKGWREKYPEPATPDTSNLPPLPEGWCWATLSQIGFLDRGKSRHRPRNASFLFGGAYPFIQTGEVGKADTFIREYSQTYSEAGLGQSRLWPSGTLCVTIAANIAETGILTFDACFPDSVVGFLSASDRVLVRYVELYLRTMQAKLESLAPATAQKNINLDVLQRVAIRLPPPDEQAELVEEVDKSLSLATQAIVRSKQGLARAVVLRQSILKRAFEGKLVPQDPNDEPASVLLERIRAARVREQPISKRRQQRKKGSADRPSKMAKRDVFKEICEGFDALKRRRDA